MDKQTIEKIVREVINSYSNPNDLYDEKDGVIRCSINKITPEKFDTGKPSDNVYLKDVFTLDQSKRLGCGIMEMTETTFDWTLSYDEISYVIEGELHININGKKVIVKQGELVHIPKDSTIQFCVPNYAKFMYTTYPADWADK